MCVFDALSYKQDILKLLAAGSGEALVKDGCVYREWITDFIDNPCRADTFQMAYYLHFAAIGFDQISSYSGFRAIIGSLGLFSPNGSYMRILENFSILCQKLQITRSCGRHNDLIGGIFVEAARKIA